MRRASQDDAERIARLHIASWGATYGRELPAEFLASQDVAQRAEGWRTQLSEDVHVLLTEEDAELSGFVACGPERAARSDGRTWEIYNLHVSPTRHRQGLGRVLFDAAARVGSERGAQALVLWVVESNTGARLFYERQGMEPDGGRQEHPVGEGHSLREVRYRMTLTGRRHGADGTRHDS